MPEKILNKSKKPTHRKQTVDIVIPYVTSTASWDELKYAVRSIEKHLSSPFRILLLSDELPEWANDKMKLVYCEQISGFENAKAFDAVSKMKKALTVVKGNRFVYAYDDFVLLDTTTIEDISFRWAFPELKSMSNINSFSGSPRWKNVLINTMQRLQANNLPEYNYETHLPRIFYKKQMIATLEMFGFVKRPYMIPTLHYNLHYPEPDGIIHPECPRIEISTAKTTYQLHDLCQGKKFLLYSDGALNNDFKEFILNMFPEKSSFEK